MGGGKNELDVRDVFRYIDAPPSWGLGIVILQPTPSTTTSPSRRFFIKLSIKY